MNRSWKKLLLKALDPLDYVARVLNNKRYLPPIDLRWDVGPLENFEASAAEFRVYLKLFGGLRHDTRFLDIGCGCGQTALALREHFGSKGSYVGCDISRDAIAWCNHNITQKDSRFEFFHMDVQNGMYNPSGKMSASEYRFPGIGEFDLVLLKSIFTHMMKNDVDNYTAQLPRLLKDTGKCIATFFLLNDRQRLLSQSGGNRIHFHSHDDTVAFARPSVPEAIVAFEEQHIRDVMLKNGLQVTNTIYGSWSGNPDGLSHQDILILEKVR